MPDDGLGRQPFAGPSFVEAGPDPVPPVWSPATQPLQAPQWQAPQWQAPQWQTYPPSPSPQAPPKANSSVAVIVLTVLTVIVALAVTVAMIMTRTGGSNQPGAAVSPRDNRPSYPANPDTQPTSAAGGVSPVWVDAGAIYGGWDSTTTVQDAAMIDSGVAGLPLVMWHTTGSNECPVGYGAGPIDVSVPGQTWESTGCVSVPKIFGDPAGLVWVFDGWLQVHDQLTDDNKSAVDLAGGQLIDVKDGVALTSQPSLCARSLAQPAQCVWTADMIGDGTLRARGQVFSAIFGDWVNTADGVVDLQTGQKANFGATVSATDFYAGPSASKVLRITCDQTVGQCSYTPWNPQQDASVAAGVTGTRVDYDEMSPVFVVSQLTGQTDTVSGYSWADGRQEWSLTLPGGDYSVRFAGQTVILWSQADRTVLAVNATTGTTEWTSGGVSMSVIASWQNEAYLVAEDTLMMRDGATDDFASQGGWPMPVAGALLYVVQGYVFAMTPTFDHLWMLDLDRATTNPNPDEPTAPTGGSSSDGGQDS